MHINVFFDDRMLSPEPHFGDRVYPVPVSEFASWEPGISGSRKQRVNSKGIIISEKGKQEESSNKR